VRINFTQLALLLDRPIASYMMAFSRKLALLRRKNQAQAAV
jgi:hypothetical protein